MEDYEYVGYQMLGDSQNQILLHRDRPVDLVFHQWFEATVVVDEGRGTQNYLLHYSGFQL